VHRTRRTLLADTHEQALPARANLRRVGVAWAEPFGADARAALSDGQPHFVLALAILVGFPTRAAVATADAPFDGAPSPPPEAGASLFRLIRSQAASFAASGGQHPPLRAVDLVLSSARERRVERGEQGRGLIGGPDQGPMLGPEGPLLHRPEEGPGV
jgi:hypothetical protein